MNRDDCRRTGSSGARPIVVFDIKHITGRLDAAASPDSCSERSTSGTEGAHASRIVASAESGVRFTNKKGYKISII